MKQAEDGALPQYGKCKEHRPLPIVEMGLFMDSDGIPLSFCIHPGNTNEQVNHQRWQIEECFRIMKSEFKARPVFLKNDERIEAHFLTCFLFLILFRYLEKKLNYRYTCQQIVQTLRSMRMREVLGKGYIPAYTRTEITDALHEAFGFQTDHDIISKKKCKK